MTKPRPVRWLREHPRAADVVLAGFITTLSVTIHLTLRDPEIADPTAVGLVLSAAGAVPLAWRRRFPVIVLVAVLGVQMLNTAQEWVGAGWVAALIGAYSVGATRSGRALWITGAISTLAVTGFVVIGVTTEGVPWQAVLTTPVLYGSALTLGDNVRRRRERGNELVERAERAERERGLVAHQHVQLERTRIARELHDVVAHSVSVMVIQAGAARRQLGSHPDRALQALEVIESTGRQAMSEMRRTLGVLRGDDPTADLAPQPSLTTLGDLLVASTDLPVTLAVHGDLPPMSTAVEVSAYRVVQEALTNVRRHAGKVSHVGVEVSHADGRLVVEVVDDGRGVSAAAGRQSDDAQPIGYGLTGMSERVGMFGGELVAGARRGGGWRVRATFPLEWSPDGSVPSSAGTSR